MIVINTRPAERAAKLTQFLRGHGATVVELPLLALAAKPLTFTEQQALVELLVPQSLPAYQAVVVVSEAAVDFTLQAVQALSLQQTMPNALPPFVCVGQKTADYLTQRWQAQFGVTPSTCYPPLPEQQNNIGMLQLSLVQGFKSGDRVQVWRGVGGREVLIDALRARGITVTLINSYQRQLPAATFAYFSQFYAKFLLQRPPTPIWVLISSLAAWQNWLELLQKIAPTVSPNVFSYVVLQARIGEHIRTHSDACVHVVDNLQPTTIWQALQA